MKKKILILYEFNNTSGIGHLVRSRIIFNFLSKIFFVKFININQVDKIINTKFDLLILDLKKYSNNKINLLKKLNYNKILTLDNFDNNFGDLNISIYEHNKNLNKKKRLSGLKFCLIRNDLKKKNLKEKNIIFISLGFIVNKSKINLIKRIYKLRGNNQIAISPNFKNKINAKKDLIILNKKNYLNYFKNAKICVTNAGNTLVEALYLKKFCIVEAQTKKEKKFSNFLKKRKLVFDFSAIKSMNNNININYKNCIDGKGAIRIKKEIIKLVYDKNI